MKGYVAKKGNQFYAVIYEGLDPVTGKEKRTWHPAGPDRTAAERLARRLAAEAEGANDSTRSLTFGAYLTEQWLPGKANTLAESTWHSYRRKIERQILPTLGRIPIRRLKVAELALFADDLVVIGGGRILAADTVDAITAASNVTVVAETTQATDLARLLTAANLDLDVDVEADRLRVRGTDRRYVAQLAFDHRIRLDELSETSTTLEDTLLDLTATSTEFTAA